ncbi:MAG: hypothetical protein WC641_03405 [Patescibacteria group bacterium]
MSCDIISNLQFVGRDSFDCEHDPKYRRPYRVNPDVAEAQRFYAAQDDAAYLISTNTRCELDEEDEDIETLDTEYFDETSEEGDAEDRYWYCEGSPVQLHRMRPKKLRFVREFLVTRQVTEADLAEEMHRVREDNPRYSLTDARIQAFQNLRRSPPKMWKTEERIEVVYVRARPVQEMPDQEERSEAREFSRYAKRQEHTFRMRILFGENGEDLRPCGKGSEFYPKDRGRKGSPRNFGRKLAKSFTRVSADRDQIDCRDSLKARRIGSLIEEIKRERKLRQTLRRLENAA